MFVDHDFVNQTDMRRQYTITAIMSVLMAGKSDVNIINKAYTHI